MSRAVPTCTMLSSTTSSCELLVLSNLHCVASSTIVLTAASAFLVSGTARVCGVGSVNAWCAHVGVRGGIHPATSRWLQQHARTPSAGAGEVLPSHLCARPGLPQRTGAWQPPLDITFRKAPSGFSNPR